MNGIYWVWIQLWELKREDEKQKEFFCKTKKKKNEENWYSVNKGRVCVWGGGRFKLDNPNLKIGN